MRESYFYSMSMTAIWAIVIIVAGLFIAKIIKRLTYRACSKIKSLDETLCRFIANSTYYLILALMAVMALNQFGVQTASIVALLGVMGLTIGLALQGTLQNVAAGFMLLIFRPLKVGEYISAGSISGVVESVGLFVTELKTVEGIYITAPNSQLWNVAITNYSRNKIRRFDLSVGIGYGDDINKAIKTLRTITDKESRVLREPEPSFFVNSLGDSAVEVTCRYWTNGDEWWNTSRDLTKLVKESFDKAKISIPFPQQDVHHFPAEK